MSFQFRLRVLAIALASTLPSCEARNSQATYELIDSAGVAVVASHSPVWAAGVARIDAEPTIRLGSEERGPYQFAFMLGARLLQNGDIAVVEPVANEVRVFSADGTRKERKRSWPSWCSA